MNDLLVAVSLLTIIPIRRELNYSARGLAFFPLVGAVLGAILVVAHYVLRLVLPPLVVAAVLTGLWVLMTSALHLDGVSDSCDGLFAATTRERRLEILKDVHIGAFGAAGLVLLLILKFAALDDASSSALFLAPILARWAMVYAATFPFAREQGMAVLFAKGLARRELVFVTLCTFIFALPFAWLAVSAWILALLVATLLARFALARLGGLTGDIYGLICECVEVSVLLVGVVIR